MDDLLRTGPDGPTIGLLLCESHNNPIAEYALRSEIQELKGKDAFESEQEKI